MKTLSKQGYLKVSDIHKIHYRLYGSLKKPMIIYIHGGPGGSGFDEWVEHIDLRKYCFLVYDQRGCGKSKPFLETRENTSSHLIEDICKLQSKFKKDKVILLGDSWGTTLSLSYNIQYPDNIKGLILNGLFLNRDKDLKWLYYTAPKKYTKEFYNIFNSNYTSKDYTSFLKYCFKKIKDNDIDYIVNFAKWEFFLLEGNKFKNYTHKDLNKEEIHIHHGLSFLECYYFLNNCFISKPILHKDNILIFKDIPIILNHGYFDEVCLINNSIEFHKKVPSSILNKMNMRHNSTNKYTNDIIINRSLKQIKEFYD